MAINVAISVQIPSRQYRLEILKQGLRLVSGWQNHYSGNEYLPSQMIWR